MRLRRRKLLAAVTAALLGGFLAVTGSITTASTAAAAPLPYLTLSCSLPIWGFAGQPIQLSPLAVVDDVANSVGATGGNAILARLQFGLLAPFQVGQIGNGDTTVSGAQIADAVTGQLGRVAAISPVGQQLATDVQQAVTKDCGFTAHALNGTGGGSSTGSDPGSGSAGGTGSDPGTIGMPGTVAGSANNPVGGLPADLPSPLYTFTDGAGGLVPRRGYGDIPVAMPGRFAPPPDARYGGVPGQAANVPSGTIGGDDVRTAGRAVALGTGPAGGPIELPLLIAVLVLSGVTAALVRTWALRRVPTG